MLPNKKSNTTDETYSLADLIDLNAVQRMADSHYKATGLPIGLIDAFDGSVLVGAGWQDICVLFHRVNPETLKRCKESDNFIKANLSENSSSHYKCLNGLWDIGLPIIVSNQHLATLFLGQFFYEGEIPDQQFFINQASQYSFNQKAYLDALDRVPIFTRDKVQTILEYDIALARFIADLAEKSLFQKQIENEREATIEFLRFTNDSRGIEELIHAATAFLQRQTGCEAVGIRLNEENDYPYYETRGFPEEFVLAENWLCTRDEAGHPIYDSTGYPVLECMCGNVICGRFDPSKPFFTAQGSFWSNCTTELLASTSVADRQSRTRNRCNREGYESVALIPLHLGKDRLGLLQLNDRSKGRFNLETITLLERLAGYLSVALAKFRAEEKLQALKEDLELIVEKRTCELQETQKQYLHAEKLSAIGQLSASIAHEFNNPLQSVMTIIKGIERYVPLEKKEAELVDLALQECRRMKNLILSLQDFNQPSSGTKTLMDVHNSLDAIMILQKKDFNSRQISAVQNYAENLPQIMAISDQIKQVFLNLLTNAADACHKHGGAITVSTWQENDRVAVAIKDTGVGIKPEDMENIFQPFFTTKPQLKGTGLGLSVSYGIIKKHNGEFRVESQPGEGATFTVLLPIKAEVR
jgi:signal transduction histidine kinase/ligand-binding sensor protein